MIQLKKTAPIVINIGIDGHVVIVNQGAGSQLMIPGQDGYGNAFGNGNFEIGQYTQTFNSLEQNSDQKPKGTDAGLSVSVGAGSANAFRGTSTNYSAGIGPFGGSASVSSNKLHKNLKGGRIGHEYTESLSPVSSN